MLANCRRVEVIWCASAEWLSEKLRTRIVLSARFVILGIAKCDMEQRLAKETWWRVWQALTLYQAWMVWTASAFGNKSYVRSQIVAQLAWQKTMQALRARWQLKRVDPVKGPPKLPKDVVTLGMAVQDAYKVVWQHSLPEGIANSIARRQPVGQPGDSAELAREQDRQAREQVR